MGGHPGCDCRRTGRHGIITMMDQEPLDSVVGRIVESIVDAVAPEKIILFGSAARGEMTSSSDLDLLVVKDKCHQRKTAALIYRSLPRPARRSTSWSSGRKTSVGTRIPIGSS